MGDKKGRKKKARLKAERMREHLPAVYFLQPNPSELLAVLDPDFIEEYRDVECPAYLKCVHVASTAAWLGLNCRACLVFRSHNTRHKRTMPILRKIEDE